jgi:hypothetical protein
LRTKNRSHLIFIIVYVTSPYHNGKTTSVTLRDGWNNTPNTPK